jgi:hypothetical protein
MTRRGRFKAFSQPRQRVLAWMMLCAALVLVMWMFGH